MADNTSEQQLPLPGQRFPYDKMPGHWLLAHLGKKVLRPGGMAMTNQMLAELNIQPGDHVVEFAPGLGQTMQTTLGRKPASYTAVEQNEDAARLVRSQLNGPGQICIIGGAEESGLPSDSSSVVYCEAMLTMESKNRKAMILGEAQRLLQADGRYGIHELCLIPDDLAEDTKKEIQKALATTIRVNVRPLTPSEWRQLMTEAGFDVQVESTTPMDLLVAKRLIQDEGFFGALGFAFKLLRHPSALRRVLQMRAVFQKHRQHLAAIMLVGRKPAQ